MQQVASRRSRLPAYAIRAQRDAHDDILPPPRFRGTSPSFWGVSNVQRAQAGKRWRFRGAVWRGDIRLSIRTTQEEEPQTRIPSVYVGCCLLGQHQSIKPPTRTSCVWFLRKPSDRRISPPLNGVLVRGGRVCAACCAVTSRCRHRRRNPSDIELSSS